MRQAGSLEEHLEDLLGRELTAQALTGDLGRQPRVRLSPEVEPWCVLDPVLSEDTGFDCYRPQVKVLLQDEVSSQKRWPRIVVPTSPELAGVGPDTGTLDDSVDPQSRAEHEQMAATAQLRVGLKGLGVDAAMIDSLSALAQACATVSDEQAHHNEDGAALVEAPDLVARGQSLLGSIETLTATTGRLDAVLLSATRQLTGVDAQILLADKGASSPDDLTSSQREKWRAQAKKVTRKELGVLMGWGPGEIADLVALANLPVAITAPVNYSLVTGESTWRLVRRYQRACSAFTTEDAAAVAHALFGNDPKASVSERLDSAGEFLGGPWRHREFYRALDREVHKIRSRDPESTKKTRQETLASNDTRVLIEDNGTAQVMIGCTAAQGAAIADRIERAARAARNAGDKRTLCQLRTATALALLLHGTADLTGLPDDPTLITVEQSEQLTKILHGLPTAQLNVIVPLNTLIGTTPGGLTPTTGPGTGVDADGNPIPAAFAANSAPAGDPVTGNGVRSCTCECTCGATTDTPSSDTGTTDTPSSDTGTTDTPSSDTGTTDTPSSDTADSDDSRGQPCPDPGPTGQPCPPPTEPAGEVGVAEVIGKHSVFLTPDEVRTLALTPGSTMYRLLTEPVTGVLVERSISAYPFDAGMRAHIIAADVFCRMPGCLKPASMAQIDHVQEHGTPGGHTCIANGQPLDPPDHDLKTKKLWDAVIHANRDVTWTTLLGRIYTTKAHDYNQYTKLLTAATQQVEEAIASGDDPAAAVDTAVYQALSYRPAGATLEADDDDDWTELFTGWDTITLSHTPDNGRRAYHPAPEATRAEAQRHHTTDTRTPEGQAPADRTPDSENDTRDDDHRQGKPTAGQHEQPDDGPTTPWTHDPDEPPPF